MRVKGWGPSHASLALVSNRPNYEEARTGKALTGRKIVEELDRLLEGVRLADTYCTTLYREFVHDKEHEYTSADLERDGADLLTELAQIQPETIVTLGREATQFLLGDVDLESCWGIPWQTQHGVILPIHHPSAGMFSSDLACYVVAGFQTLGVYLAGGTKVRTLGDDEFPNPDYRLLVGDAVRTHLRPIKASPVLTCSADTEGWLWNPYSIQFSTTPGTGYMILAGDAIGLQHFHDWLYRVKPSLVVHSLLHDTPMLKLMAGIDIADFVYHDTQVMSFLLQLEPLGLKPGCLRHAGMTMNSYDDIIGAVADERARDYLTWVWDLEAFEHTERCQAEFDAKLAAGRRVKVLPKLPKSSLQKSVERCLKSNKPRDLWGRQDDALQTEAVKKVGFLPEATLNDVPQEKAVRYGCADSDGTTRLLGAYTPKIKALGLDSVYTLELSTYPLINRMAQIGIKPDLDHFAILDTMLEAEVEMLQDNLHTITEDENFNANSGDHVADYLFDRLGMTPLKMTKSGDRGSTNDKILEALERSTGHPAVVAIRKFRETYKLLHTFVRPLPEYVNRWPYDGRVHATYRTTRVVTGRLAASDPNVLAQPEHGAFAGDFKRGWVAEEGHVIVALDESQVELRGLGHLSQDPVICSTYRGERRNPDGSIIDLHAALAQRIFGVPPHLQDKSKHRLPAKCFHPDTEVLTKSGWKRIMNLTPEEEIVQAYPDKDGAVRMEWIVPTEVFIRPNDIDHLIHLKNEGMDVRVTPDHRMLGWRQSGDWAVAHANTFADRGLDWANAGILNDGHPKGNEAWLRLAVACQADGSYRGKHIIVWGFSKQRKIERLRQLLIAAGCKYEEQLTERPSNTKPVTEFIVRKRDALRIRALLTPNKELPWRWMCMRPALRQAAIDEAQYWDSHVRENWRMYRYSSKQRHNVDVLQALATITGRKTRLTEPHGNGCFGLSVRERSTSRGGNLEAVKIPYTGIVACLSVPSSFILVRDGGVPIVVGQSINFGIPMGMTCHGLKIELRKNGLDVDEDDAQRWLDETLELYVGVKAFKEACITEAKQHGYIRCLSGRIRYIGGINSKDERIREEAERFSFSTKIQESATVVMKRAEALIWQELLPYYWKQGKYVEPILQIHDCLKFEVEKGLERDVYDRVAHIMTERVNPFSVPLAVEGEAGPNMKDMVPFK